MKRSKVCTKCGIEKPLSEFYKHKNTKDGLRPMCIICHLKYSEDYKIRNYERISIKNKKYRENNKDKINKWKKDNKDLLKKLKKEYDENNKEKNKKYSNIYSSKRRKKDIRFKLTGNLRNKMRLTLKRHSKSLSTMFLIGCEIDYLMYHLQEQFTEGMSWDNYGYWHVDHIKPCTRFDLSKPEEQRKCFHYTNLQPLWAVDNIKKGNKYEE